MDVNVNEESIEKAAKMLENLPDDFDEFKKAAVEAKNAVEDIGAGSYFYDYSGTMDRCAETSATLAGNFIESLGLLKVSKKFEAGETVTIYDSFHGVENKPAYNLFKQIYDEIVEKISDKAGSKPNKTIKKLNKKIEEKLSGKNEKATAWQKSQEEKFKKWAGDKYNKDYKFGSEWEDSVISIIDKKLFDLSGELWGKKGSKEGKYGTAEGSIRVGSADASASFSASKDHAVLDASASINGVTAEASYQTPALTTKDGLEVLSAGVSGDVSILHAETSARAGVGRWKDKDGTKHTEVGLQLKAEADLVKAGVTGQATVAGVTATGNVGVKVGVGAQFDAGYVDGKLNFNLSLAAGIGIEVGFSLDFSKVSNYVSSKIDKYGKKFASFLSS